MNFLLLNYEFPPLGGGAGNATKEIASALNAQNKKATVVTVWFKGQLEYDQSEGCKVYRLKSRRKHKDRSNVFEMFHYVFKAIFFTRKLVREERPDKAIAFFALPTGIIAYYLYKKYRIPYILSLRGGDVPGFLYKELKWHHRLSAPLTRVVWKNASHIVANSKGLQKLAQKTATQLAKEVMYIPNGVNIEKYKPSQGNTHKESELRLLFVGRLVPQKRVHMIFEALEKLPKNTKFSFTIIGDGPLRGELESISKTLGLSKKVFFRGWVDREKLTEEYRKHDAFLLLSSEEGMPNVILEAMASGLAIIASNISGTNELVISGRNGYLVKDNNELAKAIEKLSLNKNVLKDQKKESHIRAKAFSWVNVAQAYSLLR